MGTVDIYSFGDSATHDRLYATTEILAYFISNPPGAVGIVQLEWGTGRTAIELEELCASLERAGLLRRSCETIEKWTLTRDASKCTLEDVFRCVLAEQQGGSFSTAAPRRAPNDIDLMLIQALMTIDESLRHLSKFSLERLNTGSPRRSVRHARHGNDCSIFTHPF